MTDETPRLRLAAVGIVVFSLFAALFARLYYLQILDPRTIEEVRSGQLLRNVPFQARRGRILDRNGLVLVDNRETVSITIDRGRLDRLDDDERAALLDRLAVAFNDFGLPTKVSDLESRIADPRFNPLEPVPIADDVSPEMEVYLAERSSDFPAVTSQRDWSRVYPNGRLAAHVLGYVGPLNAEEYDVRRAQQVKPYQPGDEIGKGGVERIFEDDLRGVPGRRVIEVDVRNVEIEQRAVLPPEPGADLVLTIDAQLQHDVEFLLADALEQARNQEVDEPAEGEPEPPPFLAPAGAAVVLDATNGDVLAMASYPTFDPSEFVGGISTFRFAQLTDPGAHGPLTDRASTGAYAPGSTFKPVTAYAALLAGLITPQDSINDPGSYTVENCETDGAAGCVFRNAGSAVNGPVDLDKALVVSSDVYFYRLGDQLWNDQGLYGMTPIQEAAGEFGFGAVTGIQLPNEFAGRVETPEDREIRHSSNPTAFPNGGWFTGDNVNLSIGQGEMQATPLQLANAYATLANGGTVRAPNIAAELRDGTTGKPIGVFEPRVQRQVVLPPEVHDPIVEGLTGVVADERGTAAPAFEGFPLDQFPVAGKTGTAEVAPNPDGSLRADTALFTSFAPADDPRYVVVAVLEEAGFGSQSAAPLVRRIYDRLDEVQAITGPAEPLGDFVLIDPVLDLSLVADEGRSDGSGRAPQSTTPPATVRATTPSTTPVDTTAAPATTAPVAEPVAPTTSAVEPPTDEGGVDVTAPNGTGPDETVPQATAPDAGVAGTATPQPPQPEEPQGISAPGVGEAGILPTDPEPSS